MSYNGSGTFLLNVGGYPYVTGTIISSTNVNALLQDVANGLSLAVTRDGQMTMTGPLNMGSQSFTTTGGFSWKYGAGTIMSLSTAGSLSLSPASGTSAIALGTTANAWGTGYSSAVDMGNASVEGNALGGLFAFNAYYNGTNFIYKTTAAAAVINVLGTGMTFQTAASGTAGTAITWSTPLTISTAGNVTVNAPTSGYTLVLNGATNNTPLLTQSNIAGYLTAAYFANTNAAGSSYGIMSANNGGVQMVFAADTGGAVYSGSSTPSAYNLITNNTARGTITSAGNWTLNAPVSGALIYATGIALASTVNSQSVVANFNFLSGNNSQLQMVGYRRTAGTSWTGASYLFQMVVDSTQMGYIQFGDGTGATPAGTSGVTIGASGHDAVYVNNTGNVAVNAPTSGTAFTVNDNTGNIILGTGNQNANVFPTFTNANTGASAGTIFGISTSATGNAVTTQLAAASGNGYVGTANAFPFYIQTNAASRMSFTAAGNVTINAPSSGTTLTVAATATTPSTSFGDAAAWGYYGPPLTTTNGTVLNFASSAITAVGLTSYSSGTVTIKYPGTYFIFASVEVNNATNNTGTAGIAIYKNGAATNYSAQQITGSVFQNANVSCGGPVVCAASDTITVVTITANGGQTDAYGHFTGYRIPGL